MGYNIQLKKFMEEGRGWGAAYEWDWGTQGWNYSVILFRERKRVVVGVRILA